MEAIPYFCISTIPCTMDPNKPLRILIVDDDRDDQYMLKKIFTALLPSATIAQAFNGDECLRYLEAHAHDLPALITMDVNMPLVNGIEATSQIKSNPAVSAIPLVVLSTSDRTSDREASLGAGANAYVVKPVIYEELQQAVKGIVTDWLR